MARAGSIVKKLLITLITSVVLVVGVLVGITQMIDNDGIKNVIIDRVHKHTGREMQVEGNVHTFIFPTPHVLLERVKLGNMFTAESIDVQLSVAVLLTGKVELGGLTINNPELTLEVKDGKRNWEKAEERHEEKGDASTGINIGYLALNGGKINYRNEDEKLEVTVDGIQLNAYSGGLASEMESNGQFTLDKTPYNFSMKLEHMLNAWEKAEGAAAEISITHQEDSLKFKGAAGLSGLKGTVAVDAKHIAPWHRLFSSVFMLRQPVELESNEPALSLKINGDVEASANNYGLKNGQFALGKSTGKLDFTATREELSVLTIGIAMQELHLADVDYFLQQMKGDQLQENSKKQEAVTALEEEQLQQEDAVRKAKEFEVIQGLPKNVEMAFNLEAKKLFNGDVAMDNVKVQAEMSDGEIVISQAVVNLPGDAQAVLFGLVKKGYQGLTFEGSIEGGGKSFHEAMKPVFTSISLPKEGMGAFRGKANLYVSTSEARFSESDLVIDTSRMTGAVIAYFEDFPRIDAALRLYSIDFNKLLGSWGIELFPAAKEVVDKELFEDTGPKLNLEWLKKIPATITCKTEIDYFLMGKYIGKKAAFHLGLGGGQLQVSKLTGDYNNMPIAGDFTLKAEELGARVDVALTAGALNTADYLPKDDAADAATTTAENKAILEREWSKSLTNMPYLNAFNSNFDVRFQSLTHKGVLFPNFSARGKLEGGILTVDSLNTGLLEGTVDATASITAGAVPALSSNFVLKSVNVQEVLKLLTGVENITGKVSLSGNLSMTGINQDSMMETLAGSLSIAGRDISVGGFDLPGIIRAIAAVRSVADIVNVARLALPGGRTDFYAIDGVFVVKEGLAQTGGVTLKTQVSDGMLTGKFSFSERVLDLLVEFTLNSLGDKDLPSIGMKLKGPIVDPQIILDTKALEEYIAKKTTDRILNRAPAETPKVKQ